MVFTILNVLIIIGVIYAVMRIVGYFKRLDKKMHEIHEKLERLLDDKK